MATIGEDLFTILGMIPTRDRAGIARGTMATEAAQSGHVASTLAAPPPQVQLPPQMGQGGDVQLPDNVPAEYASGKAKAPIGSVPVGMPAGQERIIASGPAAAPSRAVATQASDVLLAAYEQRRKQQEMMQLIGSLGLMANAFNRNPDSQASTREALSGMVSGGGGGGGGIDLKDILAARTQEQAAAQTAQRREQAIQHAMQADGLSRERAEVLFDTQNLAKRWDPTEMRHAQGIREKEDRKAKLRAIAPDIAKARGTALSVIEAMIDDDPDAVAKLVEAAQIESLTGVREDNLKKRIDNTRSADDLKSTYDIDDDVLGFVKANPDLTETELRQYKAMGPTARGTYKTERARKLGEIDELGKEDVKLHRERYYGKDNKGGVREAELANAGILRQQADAYFDELRTGSPLSEKMLNLSKLYAKATGQPLSEATQNTEKFLVGQGQLAAARLKTDMGSANLSNIDLAFEREISGGAMTTPKTMKYILYMLEKANNAKIQKHNEDVEKSGGRVAERSPLAQHQEPTRIMKEIVAENWPGYVEGAVKRGVENDPEVIKRFEKDSAKGMGPGLWKFLVAEEKARQAAQGAR
jgi:hypothetical protein